MVCFHNRLPGPIAGPVGSSGPLLSCTPPVSQRLVSPSLGVTEKDYEDSESHWDLCLYYNKLLERKTPQTFEFDCLCEDLEESVEDVLQKTLQTSDDEFDDGSLCQDI